MPTEVRFAQLGLIKLPSVKYRAKFTASAKVEVSVVYCINAKVNN